MCVVEDLQLGWDEIPQFFPTLSLSWWLSVFLTFSFVWIVGMHWKWVGVLDVRATSPLVFLLLRTYAYVFSLDFSSTRCHFLPCLCGKQLFHRYIVRLGVDDNGTCGLQYG